MIHYSCDRCKRMIHSLEELRYSVTIEVQVALDIEELDQEGETDQLQELKEILSQLDEDEKSEVTQAAYQQRNFDLCADCRKAFMENPLALEVPANFGFSEN